MASSGPLFGVSRASRTRLPSRVNMECGCWFESEAHCRNMALLWPSSAVTVNMALGSARGPPRPWPTYPVAVGRGALVPAGGGAGRDPRLTPRACAGARRTRSCSSRQRFYSNTPRYCECSPPGCSFSPHCSNNCFEARFCRSLSNHSRRFLAGI